MKKTDIITHIDTWVSQGLITKEQAGVMKEDVTRATSERSGNFFITSLMYMGAFALALGVLLFIASNWPALSKEMKLVMSLLLPIIPLFFAYFMMVVKEQTTVLARAANVVGVLLVGGALALIGQIYHLEADMVQFLFSWSLLTIPFIWVFRKPENVVFSAIMVGVTWLYWLGTTLEDLAVTESTMVLVMSLAVAGYLSILYCVGWLLRYHADWTTSGHLLRLGAAQGALLLSFITTFEFYARALTGEYSSWYTEATSSQWIIVSLALNAVFIIALTLALMRAIRHEEYQLAFTIVRLFGFYLIVKYFSLFFTMLDTGVFFMVGGVIFVTGGWYLERRKAALLDFFKRTAETA